MIDSAAACEAPLCDTHAHLDDEQLVDPAAAVARARAAGVSTIIAVGTSAASSVAVVALARQLAGVYAAVGIQPNHVAEAAPDDWDRITGLVAEPRVVAVGETGLDRYWDRAPFPLQQEYFDRHLQLAQLRDLAFIVHMRDCAADILAMLEEARRRGPLRGVMHSFTGDQATAEACLTLGLHLSFAGMVTYTKSEELRQIASRVPDDRLLIETDAPYLSPHPRRGQRPNEPAWLVHTAQCLAAVRGVTLESLAAQTTANARQLFRIL